ncbi:P-loop NTPase fold protein, partial [Enterobacter hormaechei]|uniref:P-loop NTPase fold protein n=1 Tax=Enterobacter hormaechei TaxID=158836 RepID=UPI0029D6A65B
DDIDKIKESIVDATNATWESYIEDKIKNSQEEEDKIENFRAILRSIHEKTNNKTLFIIDELDRARPDFSLNLLELIKHIFNVDGFYFLLVM